MKIIRLLALFILISFITGMVVSPALVTALDDPPAERNVLNFAEIWAKWRYNATDLEGLLLSGMPQTAEGVYRGSGNAYSEFWLADDWERINQTVETFGASRGSMTLGNPAELNNTNMVYSDGIWQLPGPAPVDFSGSSAQYNYRTIAQTKETEMSHLEEQKLQYFVHETSKMNEVGDDLAQSTGNRTWTQAEINVTATYVRMGLDYDMFKAVYDGVISHAKWDTEDSMSSANLVRILEDVYADTTLDMILGIANITAIQAISGQSSWDASVEFEATLDNDTDSNLFGFQSGSAHISNALLGYILEEVDFVAATAMLHRGQYGIISTKSSGPFRGIEIGLDASGDAFIGVFYDIYSSIVDGSMKFVDGFAVMIGNTVKYIAAVAEKTTVPYLIITLIALSASTAFAWMYGGFSFEGFMDKASTVPVRRKGKVVKSKPGTNFGVWGLTVLVGVIVFYYFWLQYQ